MGEDIEKLNPEELVQFNKKAIQNAIFLIETKINEIIDVVNTLSEEPELDDEDDDEVETPIRLTDINPAKPRKK